MAQRGIPDRWSDRLETFTSGRGDREDYAIAKYVALTRAGVPTQDVKLVIVRDSATNEDHAVVAVRLDGSWIILDNRWLALVEDIETPRAVPLFVLDQEGVKQFPMQEARRASGSGAAAASAPASLRRGSLR